MIRIVVGGVAAAFFAPIDRRAGAQAGCPAGLTDRGGVRVDIPSDPSNCFGCGIECGDRVAVVDRRCAGYRCASVTCEDVHCTQRMGDPAQRMGDPAQRMGDPAQRMGDPEFDSGGSLLPEPDNTVGTGGNRLHDQLCLGWFCLARPA